MNDINGATDWAPIIINTVITINTHNGFGHVRIKMYVGKILNGSFNGELDGVNYSTFYIKYLHT